MRNSVSFYKQYRHRPALSSGWAVARLVVLAGLVTGIGQAAGPAGGPVGTRGQGAAGFQVPGTPSPALARLFTPRHAPQGAYQVTVLGAGIVRARQAVLEAARDGAAPAGEGPPIRKLDPLEAFGEAGSYDQTTVARLYTGRRAEVVRIPVERGGRTVAAVTLVSPYPDPTLSGLEEGTLVIVMHLDKSES
jgi:hypothetical protein